MIEGGERLFEVLSCLDGLAIAVSGGIDSITLSAFAHRFHRSEVQMVHAASPAVPAAATARLRQLARSEGWWLTVTDARELADPRYRDNPANRCYFCKSNLYDKIRALTSSQIASGANLDDLGDYRPGLLAAGERSVVHPFVDAQMGKGAIRRLARALGLDDLAEMPAQPCLASRIETGIAIDPGDLAFVEMVERRLGSLVLETGTIRCRVMHSGIMIESDRPLDAAAETLVRELCASEGRVYAGARNYRRGSMFVRATR